MPVCEVHHMEAITPPIFGLENKTPKFRIIILKICSNHKNSADILIRGEWRDAQTFMDVQTVLKWRAAIEGQSNSTDFFFFFFSVQVLVYMRCVFEINVRCEHHVVTYRHIRRWVQGYLTKRKHQLASIGGKITLLGGKNMGGNLISLSAWIA